MRELPPLRGMFPDALLPLLQEVCGVAIDEDTPLAGLNLDSLAAVRVRNSLQVLAIPTTLGVLLIIRTTLTNHAKCYYHLLRTTLTTYFINWCYYYLLYSGFTIRALHLAPLALFALLAAGACTASGAASLVHVRSIIGADVV